VDDDPCSLVRDGQDTSSFLPDNPLNHVDVLHRAIVMPGLSFLSTTFVAGFQPEKEWPTPWIR